MWKSNRIFLEDLNNIAASRFIPWEKLRDKTIFVTGATGLIGYNLIAALIFADMKMQLNLKICALVRNEEAANLRFAEIRTEYDRLTLVVGTVEDLPEIKDKIDYIIHAASPTASGYFVNFPVETIKTAVGGTMNVLELAVKNKAAGFVYCSSMEVYGNQEKESRLSENETGCLDPLSVRNSYPESKRMCEALIAAYSAEYGLPAMSIRLAQTFGPGVNIEKDTRVFAEFARCLVNKKDIVLLTEGKSKRGYLYTVDAVTAILTVLLCAQAGCAYNAMNEAAYCSITEMAAMIAEDLCNGEIKVKIAVDENAGKKYSPLHFYLLNTDRLSQTGWKASVGLADMYLRMSGAWLADKRGGNLS